MRKNKSIQSVLNVVETCGDDARKRIRKLKQCVKDGRKAGDILMEGAAFCCLAEACNETEDLHGLLINALKAVTILKNTEEYELTAKAYSALGKAYTNQGNNAMALVCDELAYGLVKKHRIQGPTRIAALNNLSVGYHMMEATQKGIRYLNECIDLLKREDSGNDTDFVMYSLNLAQFHRDAGNLDRADGILRSIAGSVEKVDYPPLVCDYYLRCAVIRYLLKDLTSGNDCMDKAFSVFPENLFPLPLYDDLCEAAILVSKNGDRARSDRILGLMTAYAEKNSGTIEQLFAVRMMAHYYRDFGDYEKAAEYYAKYEELNEKQMREQKEMQLQLHNTTRNTEAEIRRLKRMMREKEILTSREPMTGLLNRSALLAVSSDFIETAKKRKMKVGAIFIDIDFFKQCNDTYGHAKGDEIIKTVADVCRQQETRNARFARYGGDEFFGLALGMSDEELCDMARRICRSVRDAGIPNEKNPNGGILTLSVGVVNVSVTERTDSILVIANYADKALYHAKNTGKNAIYKLEYHSSEGSNEGNATYEPIGF